MISARVISDILQESLDDVPEDFSRRMAESFAGRVRDAILSQLYHWAPLSPPYVAFKKRKKLDPRTLYATGAYVNSIRARKQAGKTSRWVVGPSPTGFARPNVSFKTLGVWLEFGTRYEDQSVKMPARPHFRPVWEKFLRERRDLIASMQLEIAYRIRKAWKKKLSSK